MLQVLDSLTLSWLGSLGRMSSLLSSLEDNVVFGYIQALGDIVQQGGMAFFGWGEQKTDVSSGLTYC